MCNNGGTGVLLLDWVKRLSEAIQGKERKERCNNHLRNGICKDNLADEIYLDTLAEKLNISSGYLLTYFKGKNGN